MKDKVYALGIIVGNTVEVEDERGFLQAVTTILGEWSIDSSNQQFTIGYANARHISIKEAQKEIEGMNI